MMGDDDRDARDVARQVADHMMDTGPELRGWTFKANAHRLEIETPTGQKFVFAGREVTGE